MCAHVLTYPQCRIIYCYTYRLLYAGAAQGELPKGQERVLWRMTVPRNSFTRYYRQFLRISFINQLYRRVRRPRRTVANDLHTFNRRGGHWPPTQRKTTMSILHSPFSILNSAQKRTRNSRFGFFYLTPAQTLRYRADNICRVPRSAAHGCHAR